MLWIVLLLVMAVIINVTGIVWLGDILSWDEWLKNKASLFLIWRLLLYAATVYGWMWMRKRVLRREPKAKDKLHRAEICAVLSVVLMEVTSVLSR